MRIFISSVQKEFEPERAALGEFIAGDPLLRSLFTTFIFERDVPASDRRPDAVYLHELAQCELYIGLFGDEYGWENAEGRSPTHLEFDEATRLGKTRLIFVKGARDDTKHPKMRALIREAGNQLIRRRFSSFDDLRTAVYASLVEFLKQKQVINQTPWDATVAQRATQNDLDPHLISQFLRRARRARAFPLPEDAEPIDVLTHLNLVEEGVAGRPTHAGLLLFGKDPQRHLPASIVKCAHFHGTEVAKPIPSFHTFHGTAFDLVDESVDFVLSKLALSVGTRDAGNQAPVAYEIPRAVLSEAIVNAVVHRDYTSNGSVQVMLFADRLEIWNPGTLPPALTLDKLRSAHGSFPHNPLLAEPLYLARYIERLGTGTQDMIRRCREAGLPEPEFKLTDGFVTIIWRPVRKAEPGPSGPSTGTQSGPSGTKLALSRHQVEILRKCLTANAIGELMEITGRADRTKFRNQVLNPLLDDGLVEMTIPDKPTSSKQQYRTTEQGRNVLETISRQG